MYRYLREVLLCRYLSEAPEDVFALIVGGGIAGTSLAYHLSLRGIRDVVLLERGKLVNEIALQSVPQLSFFLSRFLTKVLGFKLFQL